LPHFSPLIQKKKKKIFNIKFFIHLHSPKKKKIKKKVKKN